MSREGGGRCGFIISDSDIISPPMWERIPPAPADYTKRELSSEQKLMKIITDANAFSPEDSARILGLSAEDIAQYNFFESKMQWGTLSEDEMKKYHSLPLEKLKVYSSAEISFKIKQSFSS